MPCYSLAACTPTRRLPPPRTAPHLATGVDMVIVHCCHGGPSWTMDDTHSHSPWFADSPQTPPTFYPTHAVGDPTVAHTFTITLQVDYRLPVFLLLGQVPHTCARSHGYGGRASPTFPQHLPQFSYYMKIAMTAMLCGPGDIVYCATAGVLGPLPHSHVVCGVYIINSGLGAFWHGMTMTLAQPMPTIEWHANAGPYWDYMEPTPV